MRPLSEAETRYSQTRQGGKKEKGSLHMRTGVIVTIVCTLSARSLVPVCISIKRPRTDGRSFSATNQYMLCQLGEESPGNTTSTIAHDVVLENESAGLESVPGSLLYVRTQSQKQRHE
jgi:hypothetical protein